MKLDIGCGSNKREGYEGVDLVALDGVDHVFDLCKDFPFADNSVEAISTSHFLEHLKDMDSIHVLRESFRVLQPGGEIEIVVPYFSKILQMFLDCEDFEQKWQWHHATIFGNQVHEGEFHKSGFDEDKLHFFLYSLGFTAIQIEEVWTHQQPSLRALARKPEHEKA